MDRKQKLSPESFLEQFTNKYSDKNVKNSSITTSQLSDALFNLTGKTGVIEGLKPVGDSKIFGRARTVQTSSDDWGTVIHGIYAAKKGDVLVISCDGEDKAVWGELASKSAQMRGIAGTVIYGASRDSGGIMDIGYPVFSRMVRPNAGKPLSEGEINKPIICGNINVKNRDLIVGDECGVVRIPDEISSEVLKEAYGILENEHKIFKELNQGKSFLDILNI
jgi:3-hexulose-6-phosphate synthase